MKTNMLTITTLCHHIKNSTLTLQNTNFYQISDFSIHNGKTQGVKIQTTPGSTEHPAKEDAK